MRSYLFLICHFLSFLLFGCSDKKSAPLDQEAPPQSQQALLPSTIAPPKVVADTPLASAPEGATLASIQPDLVIKNFCPITGPQKGDAYDHADLKHRAYKKFPPRRKPSLKGSELVVMPPLDLDKQAIKRTINRNKDGIRNCFITYTRSGSINGHVQLGWTVLSSGEVSNPTVIARTVHEGISNCLVGRIKGWRFPPPKSGAEIDVKYTFEFSDGETSFSFQDIISALEPRLPTLSPLEKKALVSAYLDAKQLDKAADLYFASEADFLELQPHERDSLLMHMEDALEEAPVWPRLKDSFASSRELATNAFVDYQNHINTAKSESDPALQCKQYGVAFQRHPHRYDAILAMSDLPLERQAMQSCVVEAVAGLQKKQDISVILMWDDRCADIDLMITEPDGQNISYQKHRSPRGGKLYADLTGFGPEVYLLESAPPGDYMIHVRYEGSGDRSNLPASGTLTVITQSGTEAEKRQTFPFTLNAHGEQKTLTVLRMP